MIVRCVTGLTLTPACLANAVRSADQLENRLDHHCWNVLHFAKQESSGINPKETFADRQRDD